MNEELRNMLGKTLYEATTELVDHYTPSWDSEWDNDTWMSKEDYVKLAEKVIEAFIQPIMPTLVNLTKSLVGLNQEQQDAIRHIARVVTGKELEEL